LTLSVAGPGQPIEGRAAWIAKAEHPGSLVERLTRGVIARAANNLEPAMFRHQDEVRVRAAHHQPEQRRLEVLAREHRCIDVAPEVIHAGQGSRPRRR